MCIWSKGMSDLVSLRQCTIRRTLWRNQNCCQGNTIKLFLTLLVQICKWICENIWYMPRSGEHIHEARDATHKYFGSWIIWCVEYWFHGTFPSIFWKSIYTCSCGYVSKWIEAVATPTNDANVLTKLFIKNIFTRYGEPRIIVGDVETHFCYKLFKDLMARYGDKHKVATTYHP